MILEFINEFIKYFGEYLTTDEQKIPVFVEMMRNSPALTALTDRIELYLKELRKLGRKPIFRDICTTLIDRLWDKRAQETKFHQFMDSNNDYDPVKESMDDNFVKWYPTL